MTISYHQRSVALTDRPKNSPFARNAQNKPGPSWLRWLLLALLALILLALLGFSGMVIYGTRIAASQPASPASQIGSGKPAPSDPEKLRKSNDFLSRKIESLAPKGEYVVVDSALNRVYWRNNGTTLREMVASCGTGNVLEDPASGRSWVFETPRGERKVQVKKADPVWMKPDWAFIEEGEPIPKDGSGRAKPGEMGDYAIGIGDGYYLHGTLYKRLLGRNVSHGCVRLGDDDIEFLYKTASFGTRVILY